MIPKTIHYCWFGNKDLPKVYREYMKSWTRFMPDFQIKRWDESNFNIDEYPFTRKAYSLGKMAFVSDYARLKILYEHGGVYFDTDVELIGSINDLLDKGGFMGFEKDSNSPRGCVLNVNIGLGFAVEPNNQIIKEVIDYYDTHVDDEYLTVVVIVTDILKKHGLKCSDNPVTIDGITIYPCDYFCPIEFMSTKLDITSNTRSIHHYSASWLTWKDRLMLKKEQVIRKVGSFILGRR